MPDVQLDTKVVLAAWNALTREFKRLADMASPAEVQTEVQNANNRPLRTLFKTPALIKAYQRATVQNEKITELNAYGIAAALHLSLEEIVLRNPLKLHFDGLVKSNEVARMCEGYWEEYHMGVSVTEKCISRALLNVRDIGDAVMECKITDHSHFFSYAGSVFLISDFLYFVLQEKNSSRVPSKELVFYCVRPPIPQENWMFGVLVGLSGGVEENMPYRPAAAKVAFYKLGNEPDDILRNCSVDLGSPADLEGMLRSNIGGYIPADPNAWSERQRNKLIHYLPKAISNDPSSGVLF